MVRYSCYRCGKTIKNPVEQNARYITARDVFSEITELRYSLEFDNLEGKREKYENMSYNELEKRRRENSKNHPGITHEYMPFWEETEKETVVKCQGTALVHTGCVRDGDTVIW